MNTTFRQGWYAIYTRPRHERVLHEALSEKTLTSFLPTRKILHQWGSRRKYVDEPLFPSYVFVYLSDMQGYYTVHESKGFLYYVRTGKELARISDAVINNIKLVHGSAGEVEITADSFVPGRRMVISQGPLTGLCGEVIENCGKRLILVRVDLLCRNLLVKMTEDYLMAI